MSRYAYSQTITVVRSAGEDRNGDPLPATAHTVDDVVIFPTVQANPTSESTAYADVSTTDKTLLPPTGADIRSTDRILLPGETQVAEDPWLGARWAVKGETGNDYHSPFTGWEPGGIVLIERVS